MFLGKRINILLCKFSPEPSINVVVKSTPIAKDFQSSFFIKAATLTVAVNDYHPKLEGVQVGERRFFHDISAL